jgi:transposase
VRQGEQSQKAAKGENVTVKLNRRFTKEFKLAVVQQIESGKKVSEVARAYEVLPGVVHRWRRELRVEGHNAFRGNGVRLLQQKREEELQGVIARQAQEIDFLKRVLQRLESEQLLRALSGEAASTGSCEPPPERGA